jgi:hypothetical protein
MLHVLLASHKGRAPLKSGTMRFEAKPEDGSVHPVTGNPYYDGESTAWTAANTATRTEIRAGRVIGSSTMTLAADGKSFTAVSQRSAPEDGHLYTSTIVWKRKVGS